MLTHKLFPLSFLLSLACTFPLFCALEAPPELDQALRARISEFYKLQVDHQFRRAEALIAEESKEFYYEARKPDIKSFSIDSIAYSEDMKSAVARIRGKVEIIFPGAPPMLIESVSPSTWKLEDGKWCWYFDKNTVMDTPMGQVKGNAGSAPADPVALFQSTSAAALKGAVHADPEAIVLDPAHPMPVTVKLSNVLPGPVSLTNSGDSSGLTVSIAKANLGPTESTTVTITPIADAKERPEVIVFAVQPLNQTVSVRISWTK
jgi:hypothetical protein